MQQLERIKEVQNTLQAAQSVAENVYKDATEAHEAQVCDMGNPCPNDKPF
jgi:hypothetical protein